MSILSRLKDAARHVFQPKEAREANEHAPYTILHQDGAYTTRDYPELLVAETTVEGPRDKAEGEGFSRLFDYISAKNRDGGEVAMTSPVLHDPDYGGVTPEALSGPGRSVVRFVLPAKYTMNTAPTPSGPHVRLAKLPPARVAAVTFEGTVPNEKVEEKTKELRAWIAAQGLTETGAPRLAIYDPPFAPPHARRNEVMIAVAS